MTHVFCCAIPASTDCPMTPECELHRNRQRVAELETALTALSGAVEAVAAEPMDVEAWDDLMDDTDPELSPRVLARAALEGGQS